MFNLSIGVSQWGSHFYSRRSGRADGQNSFFYFTFSACLRTENSERETFENSQQTHLFGEEGAVGFMTVGIAF